MPMKLAWANKCLWLVGRNKILVSKSLDSVFSPDKRVVKWIKCPQDRVLDSVRRMIVRSELGCD